MYKRVIAFADGENLAFRYQEMLKAGNRPKPEVIHIPDSFVWSPGISGWSQMDLTRVLYYTSVVGEHNKVAEISRRIGSTTFTCTAGFVRGGAQLIPRVHKKAHRSVKTKVVDVELTIDVMRAALTMPVDGIFILSGDGDYAQLVKEITRSSKQVYVGAFSSGLSPELRSISEAFVDLDNIFFENPVASPGG